MYHHQPPDTRKASFSAVFSFELILKGIFSIDFLVSGLLQFRVSKLTPRNRVVLEKLVVAQLGKKFIIFYGICSLLRCSVL
jgi:hypothetical protein